MIRVLLPIIMLTLPVETRKTWDVQGSRVERFVDTDSGVVCYVIGERRCLGDCAYSPAISCVKIK